MKILETERLLVRNFKAEDWQDLQEYVKQKEIFKFEPEWDISEEGCKNACIYFSKENVFLAVELKATGKMIGHIYFNRAEPEEFKNWELGYIFSILYQGKGYATEACRRLIHYAFEELGAHRVSAKCSPDNTASWKLLERLQMRKEGHSLRCVTFKKTPQGEPIWWDEYLYAILAEEWEYRNSRE
jgi:RimJ/RimL family protein N-acetyltransferase